jgi:hypothetical protein
MWLVSVLCSMNETNRTETFGHPLGQQRAEARTDDGAPSDEDATPGPSARPTSRDVLCRRKLLSVTSGAAVATLAGCTESADRRFRATPVGLGVDARERAGYEAATTEVVTTTRSGSTGGVEYEATIESHLALYHPTASDDEERPDPGRASTVPSIAVLSTPPASIAGRSINPLSRRPLRSILSGETLPRIRSTLLDRLSGVEGADAEWVTGPRRLGVESVEDTQATLLSESVTVETYAGVASDGERRAALVVFLARRNADDTVVVAGVLDAPVEEIGDGEIVGPDGAFGEDRVAAGLGVYVDLLPRFEFGLDGENGSNDQPTTTSGQTQTPTPTPSPTANPTDTPTPTPTPTPTATPTSSSTATSSSTSTPTPSRTGSNVIDDFEDGDSKEYRQLGIVNESFVGAPRKHGSTALQFSNMYSSYGLESTAGLPNYPHLGDHFRAWFRFERSASRGQSFGFWFGRDSQGRRHQLSAEKGSSGGNWTIRLAGNGSAGNTSSFQTSLSTGTWYAFDVGWGASTIEADLLDASETPQGSLRATSTGDDGSDYVAFKALPETNAFLWDYAYVLGSTRRSFPLVVDDFEDGDVGEYSQYGIVNSSVVTSPTHDGSGALEFTNMHSDYGLESTGGLAHYPHQGDRFRAWFRFEPSAGQNNHATLAFGKDARGRQYEVSAVKQRSGNDWEVTLYGNGSVSNADSFTTTLSPQTWYGYEVEWGVSTIECALLDASENRIDAASVAASGDDGSDYIAYRSNTGSNRFLWDDVTIVGST